MKRKYKVKVIWSNTSEKDLIDIAEHISADSPTTASKIFKNIREKASNLYSFPERGRVVPELRDQGISQYRELIIPPWKIIYRISEKSVYVLSVLDARLNIEDILLRRLINIKS